MAKKRKIVIHLTFDMGKALRKAEHEAVLIDLRDGRKNRAQTFKAKKGKGSYNRREKHARNGR